MLFTRSAQLWQYLLYLKTLQRLEFGDACWVQTGRFQIWPAPTSQEYKSTKLSLIVMIFIWKLFQILLNFRKINLFFKIYLCNINISVKMSQRGNIAGSFYQYLLILGFHTAMEYSYKKNQSSYQVNYSKLQYRTSRNFTRKYNAVQIQQDICLKVILFYLTFR